MSRIERMLALAVKVAESSPNQRHKHAAILTKGGNILAVGQNTEFAVLADSHISRHAEEHALRDHFDVSGILFVARITRGGQVAVSAPCASCKNFLINKTRIKRVYYTLNDLRHSFIDLNKERGNATLRRDRHY